MQRSSGAAGEGAGDADALLHAAGEFLGVGFLEAFEADDVDAAGDAVFGVGGVEVEAVEGELDVFEDGEPGEEGEILEDEGDAGVNAVEGLAVDEDFSAGGLEKADHDAQQGAFAGAAGAEDGEDLATF